MAEARDRLTLAFGSRGDLVKRLFPKTFACLVAGHLLTQSGRPIEHDPRMGVLLSVPTVLVADLTELWWAVLRCLPTERRGKWLREVVVRALQNSSDVDAIMREAQLPQTLLEADDETLSGAWDELMAVYRAKFRRKLPFQTPDTRALRSALGRAGYDPDLPWREGATDCCWTEPEGRLLRSIVDMRNALAHGEPQREQQPVERSMLQDSFVNALHVLASMVEKLAHAIGDDFLHRVLATLTETQTAVRDTVASFQCFVVEAQTSAAENTVSDILGSVQGISTSVETLMNADPLPHDWRIQTDELILTIDSELSKIEEARHGVDRLADFARRETLLLRPVNRIFRERNESYGQFANPVREHAAQAQVRVRELEEATAQLEQLRADLQTWQQKQAHNTTIIPEDE